MLKRKARGNATQEFGKSIGGVLSGTGAVLAIKAFASPATDSPGLQEAMVYRSSYAEATGDMFAPFGHPQAVLWIGLMMVAYGTTMRLLSYWSLHKESS